MDVDATTMRRSADDYCRLCKESAMDVDLGNIERLKDTMNEMFATTVD